MIKKDFYEKHLQRSKTTLEAFNNLRFDYETKNRHRNNLITLETFLYENLSEYKNTAIHFFNYKNAVEIYTDTRLRLNDLLDMAIADIIKIIKGEITICEDIISGEQVIVPYRSITRIVNRRDAIVDTNSETGYSLKPKEDEE